MIVSLCGPNVKHVDDLVLAMKLGDDRRLPPHLTGAAGGDEVVPGLVELEVVVPRLSPASR